jgi:hypothetical protein
VRVYLPSTLAAVPDLLTERRVPAGRGCAVTPALREWYASGEQDELEYIALQHAARLSLDLLADEVTAPRRRMVLAADVPDDAVTPARPGTSDDDPAAVAISSDIPWNRVQAVHVDDLSAVPLVRAALVTPDDEMVQGDLDDVDLLWYATQELADLV